MDAMLRFEATEHSFDPAAITRHAANFSKARFRERFLEALDVALAERGTVSRWRGASNVSAPPQQRSEVDTTVAATVSGVV
jgi:hypothetical protein